MKKHLLATAAMVALTAAAGPAGAADQAPALKSPPAVAAWSWSGLYLGGHAGYAFARDPFSDPFFQGKDISLNGIDPKGFLGGFQAGANWQSGAWVGGLEIDLSGTDIKGSTSGSTVEIFPGPATIATTVSQTDKFDLLGSGRARLGYLPWPNVLLYGTGGPAWTRFVQKFEETVNINVVAPVPGTAAITLASTNPAWRFGWVAGVGGEARLFDTNWLVRLEYLHYDFGDSGNSVSNGITTFTSGHLTADVIRTGLSYKLGGDAFASGAAGASYGAMPLKAPARVAAPWTWSGFYVGAHAGYGWFRDPFDDEPFDPGFSLSGVNSKGFLAGFQAGANWQRGAFVGGLEIDLSGANIKGSATNTGATSPSTTATATQADKFDRIGSMRARLGFLPSPGLLLYGTGGLAWTRFVETDSSLEIENIGVVNSSGSNATPTWLFGWVAGVGVETRLWDTNWLARIEYLHYDFGDTGGFSEVFTSGGVVTFSESSTSGHLTNDVVRAAVSYKFDGFPLAAGAAGGTMPLKAPARVAAWSWSGFYIGGHAGYGRGRDPFSGDPSEQFSTLTPSDINLLLPGIHSKGFLGGFQAGANWQAGAFVGGLEIDLSGPGIKGSSTASASIGTDTAIGTQTDKFDLLGSARVRVGYLPWQSTLVYGTGGLAWTRFVQIFDTTEISPPDTAVDSSSVPSWRFGWVAGAGVQNRLWDTNWLVRLEYLHYDFGNSGNFSETVAATGSVGIGAGSIVSTTGHLTTDVVRVGFDYKLD